MRHNVYLLNSTSTSVTTIDVASAISLMRRNAVEVLVSTGIEIYRGIVLPLVLRLIRFVRKKYRRAVTWSKKNLMIRDDGKCQYCGERLAMKDATIEHVVPRSRGGLTTFENSVIACKPCNTKKANRTPAEARMFLKIRPVQPTIMEFFRKMEANAAREGIIGVSRLFASLGLA